MFKKGLTICFSQLFFLLKEQKKNKKKTTTRKKGKKKRHLRHTVLFLLSLHLLSTDCFSMTYFFSLVAILIFIMYSFLYIIDRLCVSMWVFHFWSPECEYSFQLGLHLLKVTCVICCFFWKIKSFHFTTFVFLSLSLGWRSRYVCGRSGSCGGGGEHLQNPTPTPTLPSELVRSGVRVLKWCFGSRGSKMSVPHLNSWQNT